jgi:hypothetical protein
MRAPTLGLIVVVLILGSMAVLLAISSSPRQPAAAAAPLAVAANSVSANGFTLTSSSIEPPGDDATFPPGLNVDLVNQRCLACHSASMVLTQPPLKPEQWTAIVEKMRDVYHAPIAPGEVPALVHYLATRQTAASKPAS